MAATGYTPISLYYSTTASAVPTAGNLANGELALNIADMKLYAKNSAGTVTLLASNASTTGVDSLSFGSTGLTPSTATTGAITVAGTLNVANGGTGKTSYTANGILYASGTGTLANGSALTFDGTKLGIGNASPAYALQVDIATASGDLVGWFRQASNPVASVKSGSGYAGFGQGAASSETRIFADGETSFITNYLGGSEQMRLTSTGLGIGTSSPAYKLDVAGNVIRVRNAGGAEFIASTSTASVNWEFGVEGGGNGFIYTGQSSPLVISTSATERLRIAASGAFGLSGANYGTAGQVLTSAGSGSAPTWAEAGGTPPTQQIFTSSGTWTRPTGCKKIFVQLVGGGGNGNGFFGASGGYSQEFIDVTSISSVTVTIGAGAPLGGSIGGTTSFGAYLSATGGSESHTSGLGSGGDLNMRGYGQTNANSSGFVRTSGTTPLGVGSAVMQGNNIAASGYGGGGFDVSGFTAASGVVFVREYY